MPEANEFFELLTRKEPLCDELASYLEKHEKGFSTIHHPLVIEVFYAPEFNALLNKRLALKQEKLDKALAERNFEHAAFLHERPYRFEAFSEFAADMTCEAYWDLLGMLLRDIENQWQYKQAIREFLTNPPELAWLAKRELVMGDSDRESLEALEVDAEGRLQVFRGHKRHNPDGFSWTLDPQRAIWFAKRLGSGDCEDALLRIGYVSKANVIAYFQDRSEQEILCLPEHVEILETKIVNHVALEE